MLLLISAAILIMGGSYSRTALINFGPNPRGAKDWFVRTVLQVHVIGI